jgi:hypothetical protein
MSRRCCQPIGSWTRRNLNGGEVAWVVVLVKLLCSVLCRWRWPRCCSGGTWRGRA